MTHNTRIVAVIARKGGAGKTTTAANLAAALGKRGRVLAVDADAQGHLAVAFGCVLDAMSSGFAAWLGGEDLAACTVTLTPSAVTLLAGDESTRAAQAVLNTRAGLVAAVERFRADAAAAGFDWVVIDSGPAGATQDWAVGCADLVVVPAPTRFLDASAAFDALALLGVVASMTGRKPARALVLPVMYQATLRESQTIMGQLRGQLSPDLLLDAVPYRAAVINSVSAGVPVVDFDPRSDAAAAYRAAAAAVVAAVGGAE